MSSKYKHGDRVPTEALATRLHELGKVVTKGPDAVRREFTMRVPAELDRDADLVLTESARRLRELEAQLAEAREMLKEAAYLLGLQDIGGNWVKDYIDMKEGERRIFAALTGQGGE